MRYRDSRLVVGGVLLLILGSGPLLLIIAATSLGMTKDPNPNPIGFGTLAGLTFWPSLIMIFVGALKVSRARKNS